MDPKDVTADVPERDEVRRKISALMACERLVSPRNTKTVGRFSLPPKSHTSSWIVTSFLVEFDFLF